MSCCAPGLDGAADGAIALPSDDEVLFSARDLGDGVRQVEFSVPQVHCAACIATVENGLKALPAVEAARVNLSTKRVTVRWKGEDLPPLVSTLARLGYAPNLSDDAAAGRDGTVIVNTAPPPSASRTAAPPP